MGSSQSVEAGPTESERSKADNIFAGQLKQLCNIPAEATRAEKIEMCLKVLKQNQNMFAKQFNDADKFLLTSNEKLRTNLAAIIMQYGQTLDDTMLFCTDVLALTKKWNTALIILRVAREKYAANMNEEGDKIMSRYDPKALSETISMDEMHHLLASYETLSKAMNTEIARLKQDAADARRKMWIFIGIAAASVLLVAGAIALTVATAGAAAPVVATAAVTAVSEAPMITAPAAVGLTGAFVFGCQAITAAAMAGSLANMKSTVDELQGKYKVTLVQLEKTSSSILGIKGRLIEHQGSLSSMHTLATMKELIIEIKPEEVKEATDRNKMLDATVTDLLKDVEVHRTKYLQNLIDVKHKLLYG